MEVPCGGREPRRAQDGPCPNIGGQLTQWDTRCSWVGDAHGHQGCNAGGVDQNCRFCQGGLCDGRWA